MLIIANTIWLLILGLWTLFLYQQPIHNNLIHYLYNLGYAWFMVPSILVLMSYFKIPKGRPVYILLSLSSICFLLANSAWFYFNFFYKNATPYPSLADFLWLSFYVFALISSAILFKNQTPKITNLFEIILITVALFLPLNSFMSQNVSVSDSALITTLNYLYPLLDSFLVAIFLTVLRNNPNSKSTNLSFLFSFLFFTLADALFAFQSNSEKYWNGNISDFFFAVAAFLFFLGCTRLSQSETVASSPSDKLVEP